MKKDETGAMTFKRMLQTAGYCASCGQISGTNPAICAECKRARATQRHSEEP